MNERIETIAALLKDRANPTLGDVVQRDGALLGDACVALKMRDTQVNRAQVATLLGVMGVETHQTYPRVMYHAEEAPRTVANETEVEALGPGWSDEPVKPASAHA